VCVFFFTICFNAMSTTQLWCDTGISPFWIHPPVGCRPRCLIGFYFPLAALPWPLGRAGPQIIPKSNPDLFYSSPCALTAFIRHAVHSSPTFVTLCTRRLHSPPWRCALIAFIRHAVRSLLSCIRHAVYSSAHRFHSPRCALIASIRPAVHSSPPFTALCAHRFHSPRCALTPLGCLGSYCPYHVLVFSAYNIYAPYLSQARLGGSCLLVLWWWPGPISCSYPRGFKSHRGPLLFGQTPGFLLFRHAPRAPLCTHRFHSPRCALIASIRCDVRSSLSFVALCTRHSLGVSTLPISYILSRCL
jgi:hypothetical protein